MVRGKYNLIEDGKSNDVSSGLVLENSTLRINKSYTTTNARIKLPIGLGKVGKKKSKKSSSSKSNKDTNKNSGASNGNGNHSSRSSRNSPRSTPRGSNEDITPRSNEKAEQTKTDMPGGVEIAGSSDGTSSEVRESRKILSDAAIVKIMKREKSSKLRPLIEKVKQAVAHMWHASGEFFKNGFLFGSVFFFIFCENSDFFFVFDFFRSTIVKKN